MLGVNAPSPGERAQDTCVTVEFHRGNVGADDLKLSVDIRATHSSAHAISMPRWTDGTNTRSTHWPESDSLNAMPELRGAGASWSATSANCPAPPVCFLCRYLCSARP